MPETNPETRLIMGIDPSTVATGYGVITDEQNPRPVAHGVIRAKGNLPIEERLHQMHTGLLEVIGKYKPDTIAVEEPFFGMNAKSSMAVGQAQAIAFIAASSNRIPLHKYPPATVKTQVTNDGRADKKQVRDLVAATLNIPDLPLTDEADALAVALCHLGSQKEREILEQGEQSQTRRSASRRRNTQ